MSAPYNPPVRGEDFITYIALKSFANPESFQVNPTIAAGDFKVSKDGGSFNNLSTLPSVEPSGGRLVKITLSATEMTADNVAVQCIDQTAPPEWCERIITIVTPQ
jgi:hypothetical protein